MDEKLRKVLLGGRLMKEIFWQKNSPTPYFVVTVPYFCTVILKQYLYEQK